MTSQTLSHVSSLPALGQLPFAENVAQLHAHNVKVAQVCIKTQKDALQKYEDKKMLYDKTVRPRQQERAQAAQEITLQKQKAVHTRAQHQSKKKEENLERIERAMERRREAVTQKEEKMMHGSKIRRQQYLQTLTSSFHKSPDRRFHMLRRSQNEMNKSMALFHNHHDRMEAASARRQELMSQTQMNLSQRNNEDLLAAQRLRHEKNHDQEELGVKRLMAKYQAAERLSQERGEEASKIVERNKKLQQESIMKHHKLRTTMLERLENKYEDQASRTQMKIKRANRARENNLDTISQSLNSKRKQKQQQIIENSFYLQQEQKERIGALEMKRLARQDYLETLQDGKEQLHTLARGSLLASIRK